MPCRIALALARWPGKRTRPGVCIPRFQKQTGLHAEIPWRSRYRSIASRRGKVFLENYERSRGRLCLADFLV